MSSHPGPRRLVKERHVAIERPVLEGVVRGGDDDGVILGEDVGLAWDGREPQVVLAALARDREVRIAVVDPSARLPEQLQDLVRRRLAVVVDVRLVREPEHEDTRALERLAILVESLGHLPDHVTRHLRVDLPRQLDEARKGSVLGRLPGEIEGIERDAVAAQPRSRVERHEAERLGLRRLDHLPDIDTHPAERHLQLVDESDVDRAEDVLEELARLRHARR